MYNSTKTSDVKTRHKNNYRWIYLNMCIIPAFFCPVQTLCNLVSGRLLLSLALMPKLKRPWRQVWALQLCSRPPLMQGFRVLFWMWIIWKIRNIILLKKKKWQKKTSAMHTNFVLWTVIFLFLLTFYTVDDSLKLDFTFQPG